ncbi:KWG repeat protein [Caldicellulosiruptor acetigenus I77R1B]|uniref:KWG repeat protein n=1 Tax=Caldicellulosiruptor acetigenus (strain ATCC 700853 / DSM 12137 / I77R1B) TaxID=632335 RepID=E4S8E5_CALA7|nr:WG repeat-containing protein [Caldicellulosiruptor acetigenus]ADQ41927.1 KWG repeat protein [Caldicellulosiruptor acetigenus I77R1B]WAM36273.1 WG repeat-containing protein [Caldicellulosiruptor acetigenus]
MKKIKMLVCFLLAVVWIINPLTFAYSQQASSQKFVYIKPQFENVMFWPNGWISYLQGGKWGILSSSGNVLLNPQFDKIEPIVYDGPAIMGIEDKFYKDIFIVWQNGKVGFLDNNAKILVKPELDSFEVLNPWLDVYVCKKDSKYGFLNLDKKAYVSPQFDKMYFVVVFSYNSNAKYPNPHVKCTLPNESSNEYCLYALDLKDGTWPNSYLEYILVSKDGKCGAVDTNGNVFVDLKYNSFEEALSDSKFTEALQDMLANESKSAPSSTKNEIEKTSSSYILCEIVNNKYYLVFEKYTNKGVTRTKSKEAYENVKYVKVNKLMAVCKNKKWGIVDINGNYVVKPQFDDIKEFSEGFIAFKQNGKWGFMDKNFKIVIKPQFDKAENFSEGYAAVKKSGLWGYINSSGKLVIKPQYTSAGAFFAQMAAVATNDYIGLIDTKGSFVVKFSAKNSQYSFVDSETYRFRYTPDSVINSGSYELYKYTFNFPKFGYVVIDKKSKKVGLVLRGQGK